MGKLVRDRIPELMRANGVEPQVRVLEEGEYLESLLDKLVEETHELREAKPDARLEELADVYEVVLAIRDRLGVGWDEIEHIAARKRTQRGGFTERIWLERW